MPTYRVYMVTRSIGKITMLVAGTNEETATREAYRFLRCHGFRWHILKVVLADADESDDVQKRLKQTFKQSLLK